MTTMPAGDGFVELDLSPEEFRKLGYRVVDLIAEYYSTIRDVPVLPPHAFEEVERAFQEPLPEKGQDPLEVLGEWQSKVLPYTTHLGSPRYLGFVNGSGTMISTLAEALAASVNMNPGAWKPAPAATEIEHRAIAWIAELIGYPPGCGRLFTSGSAMAYFTGVLTALRNTATKDTTAEGLQRKESPGRMDQCQRSGSTGGYRSGLCQAKRARRKTASAHLLNGTLRRQRHRRPDRGWR